MNDSKKPVGLIGLGNAGMALGQAMAKRFSTLACDLDTARQSLASTMGMGIASSAREIAAACDIIILSLPTPAISLLVASQMAELGLSNKIVVEASTVGPHDVERLEALLKPAGASVVDSAVIGGVQKLAAGRTTFLVGASAADFERVRPVLDAAAEEIFHLGAPGNGMRAKLVNNAVAHTTMVMLLEAAALSMKAGLPPDVFYKLMSRDSGLMRPLTHRFGDRVLNQNFEGGMPTANARKDSTLALEFAAELGVPMFTMQASHSVYEMARAEGLDRLDYASISKLWERWADVSFASPKP